MASGSMYKSCSNNLQRFFGDISEPILTWRKFRKIGELNKIGKITTAEVVTDARRLLVTKVRVDGMV